MKQGPPIVEAHRTRPLEDDHKPLSGRQLIVEADWLKHWQGPGANGEASGIADLRGDVDVGTQRCR